MACYSNLPAEIRQRILYLSTPVLDDAARPWLKELRCLMLISKQSFNDVREIIPLLQWSIVYTIRRNVPPVLPTEQCRGQLSMLPRPTTVSLCMFYDVNPDEMRQSPVINSIDYVPQAYQWGCALSVLLTEETKTILIDATPAPCHIRRKPPSYTATLVSDIRTNKWFLNQQQIAVMSLFRRIANICGDKTDLFLVGTYGRRARGWVDRIVQDCANDGVQVHVRVDYADRGPSRPSSLVKATHHIRPIMDTPAAPRISEWHAERQVRGTNWRASTCQLYEQCVAVNAEWTSYALSQVRRFIAYEELNTLDLTPSTRIERKLAHRLIEDVGFWSQSVGEDPDRFVQFSRERLQRPWERNAENLDND